jgi:hypothetical protein
VIDLRYESTDGRVHECVGFHATPDHQNFLIYTVCAKDVPANQGFESAENVTCGACNLIKELKLTLKAYRDACDQICPSGSASRGTLNKYLIERYGTEAKWKIAQEAGE